jgi:predicted Zn-dependent protease
MFADPAGRPPHAAQKPRTHRARKHGPQTPEDCVLSVKDRLAAGDLRDAQRLVQDAMARFPDNPVLLSYHGYLQALRERKYLIGIETCRKALALLKKRIDFVDADFSVVYCNLGRACAVAGQRRDALAALNRGLAYDSSLEEIRTELRRMGMRRKKPPIPFLRRSNPFNKYLGILLHRKRGA